MCLTLKFQSAIILLLFSLHNCSSHSFFYMLQLLCSQMIIVSYFVGPLSSRRRSCTGWVLVRSSFCRRHSSNPLNSACQGSSTSMGAQQSPPPIMSRFRCFRFPAAEHVPITSYMTNSHPCTRDRPLKSSKKKKNFLRFFS